MARPLTRPTSLAALPEPSGPVRRVFNQPTVLGLCLLVAVLALFLMDRLLPPALALRAAVTGGSASLRAALA